jgi:hypothetical protein
MIGSGTQPLVWSRIRRIAGRAAVCLALVLLPLAHAGASHPEAGIAATHAPEGHAEAPASGDQDDHAPICHHLGTCHAFVSPPAANIAREQPPLTAAPAAATQPPKADVRRLFRPPRSAARA